MAAYQALPAIQDILLVDSHKRRVEHYHRVLPHRLQKWDFVMYDQDDHLIELASIGVQLTVRAIYRKVYLEQEEGEER